MGRGKTGVRVDMYIEINEFWGLDNRMVARERESERGNLVVGGWGLYKIVRERGVRVSKERDFGLMLHNSYSDKWLRDVE